MASFSHRPQCGFPPGFLLRLQRTFPPPLPRTSLQCLCSPRSHFCSPHFQSSEVKPESGISKCHRCYWENMASSSLKLLNVSKLSNTRNTRITLFRGKQYLFEAEWGTHMFGKIFFVSTSKWLHYHNFTLWTSKIDYVNHGWPLIEGKKKCSCLFEKWHVSQSTKNKRNISKLNFRVGYPPNPQLPFCQTFFRKIHREVIFANSLKIRKFSCIWFEDEICNVVFDSFLLETFWICFRE